MHRLAKRPHPVIQVGDMGVGFVSTATQRYKLDARDDLWFIRGNHDDPALCRASRRYMGDWGSSEQTFWVGGALSIDRHLRIEGRDWWPEEELSAVQMTQAFDDYCEARPRLMITHDGPTSLFEGASAPMSIRNYQRNATSSLLEAMLQEHKPDVWVFGHHHVSRTFTHENVLFRCLSELETWEVTIDEEGNTKPI